LSGAKVWLHILDFEVEAALHLGMLRGWGGLQRLLYKVERLVMLGIDKVSTISEKMRRRIVEKGVPEDRVSMLPNWADTAFVRPLRHLNEVRREFGADPDDVLVLYAGNMGEKQGLELVLDAAERLRERVKIRFAMVGAGAAQERLKRIAEERKLHNLRFFPVQPLDRLPLIFLRADPVLPRLTQVPPSMTF